MRTLIGIEGCASELVDAARRFQSAAEHPGSHVEAPDALVSLEEALQVLSGAWYQLAADAVPRKLHHDPPDAPDEAELQFVAALHDVAAGFARCARTCREGRGGRWSVRRS